MTAISVADMLLDLFVV